MLTGKIKDATVAVMDEVCVGGGGEGRGGEGELACGILNSSTAMMVGIYIHAPGMQSSSTAICSPLLLVVNAADSETGVWVQIVRRVSGCSLLAARLF